MHHFFRSLALYKPYLGWMLLGYLLTMITLFSNVILMAVSGWFIASMAIAGVAGVTMNYFSPAAIIRGASIFRTSGRYAERLVTHEATFRLLARLRSWFYSQLEPLAPAVLEKYRSGDLLNRIRADIDSLDNFYIRVLLPLLAALTGGLVFTLVMSVYDSLLALVLLLFLVCAGIALPVLILKLGQAHGENIVKSRSELQTAVVDGVQGLAELSVLGALQSSSQQVEQASEALLSAQTRMSRVSGLAQSGMLLFSHTAVFMILLIAVPLLTVGAILPAELAMLALFTLASFEAVMPLPEAFRLLSVTTAAAKRLFELADEKPLIESPSVEQAEPENFSLKIEQLGFYYTQQNGFVLQQFNLKCDEGQKLAIVGETGIGKSSLIGILMRQRPFQQGTVLLGGIPLERYSETQLRQWISVVPQKIHLFNTTIRENLLLGKPDATEAAILQALEQTQLKQFVDEQPDGLDTWVGETGVKLSGGQVRRLAIARALLRDFRMLILDEPGEGLDSITEKKLMQSVIEALQDRSLLLITHSHQALGLMDDVVTVSGKH